MKHQMAPEAPLAQWESVDQIKYQRRDHRPGPGVGDENREDSLSPLPAASCRRGDQIVPVARQKPDQRPRGENDRQRLPVKIRSGKIDESHSEICRKTFETNSFALITQAQKLLPPAGKSKWEKFPLTSTYLYVIVRANV